MTVKYFSCRLLALSSRKSRLYSRFTQTYRRQVFSCLFWPSLLYPAPPPAADVDKGSRKTTALASLAEQTCPLFPVILENSDGGRIYSESHPVID